MRLSNRNDPLLAAEVLNYLLRHPAASDTVEGIATWWLLDQRVHVAIAQVEQALSELAARDLVVIVSRTDGRMHYGLNRAKELEIRRYLNA